MHLQTPVLLSKMSWTYCSIFHLHWTIMSVLSYNMVGPSVLLEFHRAV